MFGYIAVNFFIGLFSPSATPLNLSEIELGYIKEPQVDQTIIYAEYDEVTELKRKVELLKLQKQLKELQESTPKKAPAKQVTQKEDKDNLLFTDCKDALVGLGVPVRKAKADVQNVFDQNPNIKTVQEFITEYGKR